MAAVVFKDMEEVLPGHFLICSPDGIRQQSYWKLVSRPHEDSYEETIEKTSFLVQDSIKRQMVSDVPICTFLSGGWIPAWFPPSAQQSLKNRAKADYLFL